MHNLFFFKHMVPRKCSVEKKSRTELFYFCICASLTDIIRDSLGSLRLPENDREGFMATHREAKARGLIPMGPFCPIGCPNSHPPLLPWAFLFIISCPAINWFIHSFIQCSLDAAFRIKLVRQLFKISNLDIYMTIIVDFYVFDVKTNLCPKSFYSLFYWVHL